MNASIARSSAQFAELASTPLELIELLAEAKRTTAESLTAVGYHQHKCGERSAHADYWHFALAYKQNTAETFKMHDMEQWERFLASKGARYLRVIAELAHVRLLLKLLAPQVNINLPGGQ